MRGRVRIPLAVALAAVLLAAAAGGWVGWLMGTTDGARWLLAAVSRWSGTSITARGVEGRLYDRLHLTGVRIGIPQMVVEIDDLDLRWRSLLLLAGEVVANDLSLTGVRIRDDSPPGGDLSWPTMSGLPSWFGMHVSRLRVNRLTYRSRDEAPQEISAATASLAWHHRMMTLTSLDLRLPSGRVSGSASAGFRRPSLHLELVVVPSQPVGEMDSFSLKARLLPGRSPEQMAGKVTVSGTSAKAARFELAGTCGLTRTALNFRDLRLAVPSRKGTLTGEGTLLLIGPENHFTLKAKVAHLDLAPELGTTTDIGGLVTIEGNPSAYEGCLELANRGKGWRPARLAGAFAGNDAGLELSSLQGTLLDGTLAGTLAVDWSEGIDLEGALRGRNLNPARISPDWRGVANLDLRASLSRREGAPLRAQVSGRLLESRLHGKEFTGRIRAELVGETLRIGELDLRGNGFSVGASGDLTDRLAFSARIDDLARLVPGTAGKLQAGGWVRRRNGNLSGDITGTCRRLSADGLRLAAADFSGRLREGKGYPLHGTASLRQLEYGEFRAEAATVEADGTLLQHRVKADVRAPGTSVQLALAGSWRDGVWQGEVGRFSGRDDIGSWSLQAPASLTVGAAGISLAGFNLAGVRGESIALSCELALGPVRGPFRAEWHAVNLTRANRWLRDIRLTGTTSGTLRGKVSPDDRLEFAGRIEGAGTVMRDGTGITVRQARVDGTGDEKGLRAAVELSLAEGGTVRGSFASDVPARLALPAQGTVDLHWGALDLARFGPWLPRDLRLTGILAGRITGRLLPDSRFDLRGDANLSGGACRWQRPDGELNIALRSAVFSWRWREESLSGALDLALADYGSVKGHLELPLPARFPPAFDPDLPVRGTLTGRLKEQGIVGALFPGFVRESHGDLSVDLKVDGRWGEPLIGGEVRLTGAGAYLPSAGIRVEKVRLTARLEKETIRIETFGAESGPGRIEGTAVVRLAEGRVAEYRGNLRGDNFQVVHLPELQLLATPKLDFDGTTDRLAVRGSVLLPELHINGPPRGHAVKASKDVILEGASSEAKGLPFAIGMQVRIDLGDKVFVKAEGVDARLGGGIDLACKDMDRITSRGEINVVTGHFKTYGVDLEIVRGRIFYAGGPVEQPTLDILALRTVGEVRAGVTVVGPIRQPVVKLYSEPAMPDVDVLAYIVLGHPLSTGEQQTNLMAQAAAFLLSTDQSAALLDQIKDRTGLSSLEVRPYGGESSSRMGYKAIQSTPPGVTSTRTTPAVADTMLSVGKYLTPEIYVSYGRSIITGSNLARLRYDISKRWQVEVETGAESGVDLYYRIYFE